MRDLSSCGVVRHGPYAFFTLQGFHSVFYVLLYLVAIVGANLSSTYFGPSASIVNAFLLIGLDLTTRDKLHESWQNRGLLPKMTCLIVVGAAISWLINRNSGPIALASTLAFGLAAITDGVIYQSLRNRPRMVKINASNVGSALVDSLVFPTVAFGALLPGIVAGQFVAKVLGGFLWAVILTLIVGDFDSSDRRAIGEG